tara:strand:+ start:3893 stop:4840 length:948 start_codon:yes stop_codon:yes gene_type:complete
MSSQSVSAEQIKALHAKAESYLVAGNAQAAIDELDRASEDLSAYPTLWRLKGVAKLIQGNNTEAKLIFEQLEGSFGDNPEFLNHFGVVLRRESDFIKAKEVYERGLELSSNEPALLSNYGNLLIDLGDFQKADDVLQKAIKIAPNHKDARQNLVRLEKVKGSSQRNKNESDISKTSSSKDSFQNYDKEAAADWLKLASTAQKEKNYQEALLFAQKAIRAQPDFSAACKLAGEILICLGKKSEAERLLLYGILLGEDDPSTITNLGALAAGRGEGQLALILLDRVLGIHPENQAAKNNMETVRRNLSDGKLVSSLF